MSSPPDNATTSDKNIPCQNLLKERPRCHGWLRRKTVLQQVGAKIEGKLKIGRALSSRIPWQQRYLILRDGMLYVYKDETAQRAQKILPLTNFDSYEAEEPTKDLPWPFKLEPYNGGQQHVKAEYFSATSEEERKKWEDALIGELAAVNANRPVRTGSSSIGEEDESEYTPMDEGAIQESPGNNRRPLPTPPAETTSPKTSSPPRTSKSDLKHRPVPLPPNATANTPANGVSEHRPVPLPPIESTNTQRTGACKKPEKPIVSPKPSSLSNHPAVPNSAQTSTSPPPTVPNRQNQSSVSNHVAVNQTVSTTSDDIEYELETDVDVDYETPELSLVDAALWRKSAEEAQKYMKNGGLSEGVFMIRKASDGSGYTLLVICQGAPCKFKIAENQETKTFKLGHSDFESLIDLLTHFTETNLPNKSTPLTTPFRSCGSDTS